MAALEARWKEWATQLKAGDGVVECQLCAEAEHTMLIRPDTIKAISRNFVQFATHNTLPYRRTDLVSADGAFQLFPPSWTPAEVYRFQKSNATQWPRAKVILPDGFSKSKEFPGMYEKAPRAEEET
jgi:hypothetical protein